MVSSIVVVPSITGPSVAAPSSIGPSVAGASITGPTSTLHIVGTFLFASALLFFILCFGEFTSLSADPSFDCSKSVNSVEITICDFYYLSRLDSVMAELYFEATQYNLSMRTFIRDNQRAWLNHRNAYCFSPEVNTSLVACLGKLYADRIEYLKSLPRPTRTVSAGVYGEYEYMASDYQMSITVTLTGTAVKMGLMLAMVPGYDSCKFDGQTTVGQLTDALSKGSPVPFTDGHAVAYLSFGEKSLSLINFGTVHNYKSNPFEYYCLLEAVVKTGMRLNKIK
ncbi:MAG: hypothetical protein LBJ61_00105 [Deltaproteobacteria bacterium]|nr:hypothetical protein [Deltaproteobacteria bacterium]